MSAVIIFLEQRIDILERENSILRSELKLRLVNEFIENYEFSEDEAEEAAEREVTGLVLHNEGAE
jgi:hypothetical protein